jgi:hypothetical protein
MSLIPSWSFSRLKDYEKCPYMAWLKYCKRESQDHMDTKAADRGTMIHDACENYVRGKGDFIKEMKHFKGYFEDLKIKFEAGDVILEENWGFTKDWLPCGWMDENVWCRMKLDNFITKTKDEKDYIIAGAPTDYKSGKKYGNEVSHGQQGQLYAIGSFMKFPTLEVADVELLYLDQNKTTKRTYTREKAMKFLPSWNKRALAMTEAEDFPPKPNKMSCMWCPFGPQNGNSSCEWGV